MGDQTLRGKKKERASGAGRIALAPLQTRAARPPRESADCSRHATTDRERRWLTFW